MVNTGQSMKAGVSHEEPATLLTKQIMPNSDGNAGPLSVISGPAQQSSSMGHHETPGFFKAAAICGAALREDEVDAFSWRPGGSRTRKTRVPGHGGMGYQMPASYSGD